MNYFMGIDLGTSSTKTLIMDENGLLDKPKIFKAEEQECDHREYSFNYSLPGYGVAVFTY